MSDTAEPPLRNVCSSEIDVAGFWERRFVRPAIVAADGTALRTWPDVERWLVAELARRFPEERAQGGRRRGMTLEEFVDAAMRRLAERGFAPREFLALRDRAGLVPAIAQSVEGDEVKPGFLRVLELGMAHWSLEAAVTRFPNRFSRRTVSYASARLRGARP